MRWITCVGLRGIESGADTMARHISVALARYLRWYGYWVALVMIWANTLTGLVSRPGSSIWETTDVPLFRLVKTCPMTTFS